MSNSLNQVKSSKEQNLNHFQAYFLFKYGFVSDVMSCARKNCSITYPKTSRLFKKTRLSLFLTNLLVLGYLLKHSLCVIYFTYIVHSNASDMWVC